jgi:hypothetical protein
MSWELAALLALGALAWYWASGMKAREHAVAAGRRACQDVGVQFLDDTVALAKTRLVRNEQGQVQIVRLYRFEFSDTGDNRRPGNVSVQGGLVEWVDLDGEWLPGRAQVLRLRE